MNYRSAYLITILSCILFLFGIGTVSAYYLSLEAPSEVRVGQQIEITGTTNVPPPDKIDIVLSHSINIPVEKARQSIDITEKGDNSFNITFNTTGLEKGNYKVEALSQTQRVFSAGSRNLRVVKLIDRSDIIRFSSPLFQDSSDTLLIEARIQGYEDQSIQMEVLYGDQTIFGPESIPVSRGLVKYELPITEQGSYSVIFHDYKGYIGTYHIQVGEGEESSEKIPAVTVTESSTPKPVSMEETPAPVTTTPSHTPTSTQIPSSTPTSEKSSTSSVSEGTGPIQKITTQVSRDSPAYFLISVKETPVTISTSAEDDWVLEYKTADDAAVVKVNDKMKNEAETATISGDTSEIYGKVYPYSYKSSGEVTISASNAHSISLSDVATKAFGAPPRYGEKSTETAQSPAPLAGVVLGICGALWCIRRR